MHPGTPLQQMQTFSYFHPPAPQDLIWHRECVNNRTQPTHLLAQHPDLIALQRLSLIGMKPRESIHPMAAQASSLNAFGSSCNYATAVVIGLSGPALLPMR